MGRQMEENGYEPQSTASLVAKAPKDSPKLKRNNQPICKWKKKTVVPDFTREIGWKWEANGERFGIICH